MIIRSIFILLLFASFNVQTLEMYRYKDDNGKWAFTDKKPITNKEVKKTTLKEQRKQELTVKIEKFELPNSVIYKARNEFFAPVSLKLEVTTKKNVTLDRNLEEYQIIPANGIKTILKVKSKNPKKGWSFGMSIQYILGDPNKKIDENYLYGVPFASGTKYQISQGFNGEYSHQGEQNRYAIDIAMPVGTHINASRSGIVVDVAFRNYKSGVSSDFLSKANIVRIMHDDGSIATYAHLKWEGIRVEVGDEVEKGEYIADSGNTGYSSGPHLHFVIHKNDKNNLVSVPFKFVQKLNRSISPSAGLWLKSP